MRDQAPLARPRLLITAGFDESVRLELCADFDVTTLPVLSAPTSLGERLTAADLASLNVVVCEVDTIDADTVARCPNLSLVISCRGNPVNVDTAACHAASVTVVTTPARNADVTADLAFTLLLMVARRTAAAERWLRAGLWHPDEIYVPYSTFRGMGMTGRTLGLIGAGAVGKCMASRARGFGMDVIAFDPFASQEDFGDLLTLRTMTDVLSESDAVSIHAPLNDSTRGMIGAAELSLMRPSALLVNAGRAAIVDEAALLAVLESGAIAGAGLDVYWTEPLPLGHPLTVLENVVLTPHIGGASDDVIVNHSAQAARALRAWLTNQSLPNVWDR